MVHAIVAVAVAVAVAVMLAVAVSVAVSVGMTAVGSAAAAGLFLQLKEMSVKNDKMMKNKKNIFFIVPPYFL
jgi:hypothetical protein